MHRVRILAHSRVRLPSLARPFHVQRESVSSLTLTILRPDTPRSSPPSPPLPLPHHPLTLCPPSCPLLPGAKCCQIFSVSGLVFLTLIGILLQTQPIYIKDVEDPTDAASQCFQAAGIYAFFIVATTICGYVAPPRA